MVLIVFCSMKGFLLLLLFSWFTISRLTAQTRTPAQKLITNEDSLNGGLSGYRTVISGYGSASYQRNFDQQTATLNLDRAVLFVGHQFNSNISFFSELELENAKVDGSGGSLGEIAMEQAFLKFSLSPRQYIVAGLFIPRIGILNENHLPVNFNGVERPLVEQLIIPATWRELGVSFYGRAARLPLNYSVAIMNGLSSEHFVHGSGIREGRFEGSNATANNLAVTASLQYAYKDFRFQVSGYAGGTNGLNPHKSDSLQLQSGIFGVPLYLGEGDIQYASDGISIKALGTIISFPNASDINRAYGHNIAEIMYGAYAEFAYNVLEHAKNANGKQLNAFARYEILDMNSKIPASGIYDGTIDQQHLIVGLGYLPIPNVVIKLDVRLMHTGPENPELVSNPSPVAITLPAEQQFFEYRNRLFILVYEQETFYKEWLPVLPGGCSRNGAGRLVGLQPFRI